MEYDVFISHASEDKKSFVAPLANFLLKLGVKVWYDEFTLKPGDSLSRSIDQGLSSSRFGIVVLSSNFMSKAWPEYELRGLTAKEIGRDKVILPVWHGVSKADILKFSPPLADKFALDTSKLSLQEIAIQLTEVVRPDIFNNIHRRIIESQLEKDAEIVKVNLRELTNPPIRHKKLPPQLLIRIKIFHSILNHISSIPLEETINNFRRDVHPEREVAIWERVTAAYLDATSIKLLSLDQRKEIFSYILQRTFGPVNKEIIDQFTYVTWDEAQKLENLYCDVVPKITDPEELGPIQLIDIEQNESRGNLIE